MDIKRKFRIVQVVRTTIGAWVIGHLLTMAIPFDDIYGK